MISVILLAAWSSIRFWNVNKLKALLWWIPVFLHSLVKFYKHPQINEIIIVTSEKEIDDYRLLQKTFPKIKDVVIWWKQRQESVKKWLDKVNNEILLIHNWSNPLVTDLEIEQVIKNTQEYWACAPWLKAINTLKKVDEEMMIKETIPREDIYEVQTPQWVNVKTFRKLVNKKSVKTFTDDVSYFENANLPVKIVLASENNFKITNPSDLLKAENIVRKDLIIWIWHDSHRLIKWDKPLIIWATEINSDYYFEWNSDWDILLHALCNAIWTAIWEWSLSLYSDKMCKMWQTNSIEYLKHIYKEMKNKGYQIWNLSISIEWKEPKLESFIPKIKENLAKNLECTVFQIWIACTSWEWLTSFWKWEGMQCFVNLILRKN